jgi:hypothetical protein
MPQIYAYIAKKQIVDTSPPRLNSDRLNLFNTSLFYCHKCQMRITILHAMQIWVTLGQYRQK